MKCASALSTARNSDEALAEVLERAASQLGKPATGDLAVVFSSAHHADSFAAIGEAIRAHGLARVVIGCTSESIIGEGQEIEGATALSLWIMQSPCAELEPLRFEHRAGGFDGWPDSLATNADTAGQALIMLGDPFTFPTEEWLEAVRTRQPHLPVFGGMASAGRAPGVNRFILDRESYLDGAVGVRIGGNAWVRPVVSQGCRPIGEPFVVTKVEGNLLRELGGLPALERLKEVFEELDSVDQELIREGLHVGRAVDEYRDTFGRGDFLIRNVMGADKTGALALGDHVKVGQTVQFHVRDGDAADEDLRDLLESDALDHPSERPAGALLFSCNGRGSRLFNIENHDISAVQNLHGPIPVAGFFAMGEIGPIGGKNFLHGFTASLALFGQRPGV
ncbi:FIST N-terminal domain-containing protein [Isosphaeraceae bacterium EP7]